MNEYGVIGSLLIDSSLFPEAAGLPDQAFSSPALQEVFRTMRRQYEGRGGFDALTVSVEARRNCPGGDGRAACADDGHYTDNSKPRRLHSGGQRRIPCPLAARNRRRIDGS